MSLSYKFVPTPKEINNCFTMFNNGNQGSQPHHPFNQPNQNGGFQNNQQHGRSNIANRNQGPEYNQEKRGYNGHGQHQHQEWTNETKNDGYNTRNQTQKVSQSQKQLVDQNFANNVVFMGMSVVEEIFNKFKQSKASKKFGYYDKVDYSGKTMAELKSQLQVQLMLIKTSKQTFAQEYGQHAYKLPAQFDERRVIEDLKYYGQCLYKVDEGIGMMINDFIKIMRGDFRDLFFERVNFSVQYSEHESKKHQKNLFQQGVSATNDMHEERKRIEQLPQNTTAENLPVYIKEGQQESEMKDQGQGQGQESKRKQKKDSNKKKSWWPF